VTYHRVIGGVLLYLRIAMIFVVLYAFVGLLFPNTFKGLSIDDAPNFTANLIYYSYGDIVPMHPIARSLSISTPSSASSIRRLCRRGFSPWSSNAAPKSARTAGSGGA
jgi:hypothetical protein